MLRFFRFNCRTKKNFVVGCHHDLKLGSVLQIKLLKKLIGNADSAAIPPLTGVTVDIKDIQYERACSFRIDDFVRRA